MGRFAVDFDSNDHLTANFLASPFKYKAKETKSAKTEYRSHILTPQNNTMNWDSSTPTHDMPLACSDTY
jgi:hypothetical protein